MSKPAVAEKSESKFDEQPETTKRAYAALRQNRFKEAQYAHNHWTIYPESDTPTVAFLDRDYWAHIAQHLKIGDRVDVRFEDGTRFVELYVRDCGRTWAVMGVTIDARFGDPLKPVANEEDHLKIEFKGPHTKWRVVNTKNGSVLKEKMATREEAETWRRDHRKALGK